MGLFKALHDAFFHTVSTKERNHFSKFRSMLISREGYAERHVDLLAFQFVAFLDCFEDPFDAVVIQFIQAMEAFDEGFHDKGHCFFFEDGNGFFIFEVEIIREVKGNLFRSRPESGPLRQRVSASQAFPLIRRPSCSQLSP